MKKTIVFFAFILYSVSNFAQQVKPNFIEETISDSLFEDKIMGIANTQHINLQAYLNKRFQSGNIHLTNGNLVKNKLINYDCQTDQLLWVRQSNYQIVIVDKALVQQFIIHNENKQLNTTFKKINITAINNSADIYLQVLTEGDVSLFVQHKKQETNNVFQNYDTYFIKLPEGQITRFNKTKAMLYKQFPSLKNEMKILFTKEHIRMKQESDMTRAIEIINTLLLQNASVK